MAKKKTTNKIIGEYVERKDIRGLAEYFRAYITDEILENDKQKETTTCCKENFPEKQKRSLHCPYCPFFKPTTIPGEEKKCRKCGLFNGKHQKLCATRLSYKSPILRKREKNI